MAINKRVGTQIPREWTPETAEAIQREFERLYSLLGLPTEDAFDATTDRQIFGRWVFVPSFPADGYYAVRIDNPQGDASQVAVFLGNPRGSLGRGVILSYGGSPAALSIVTADGSAIELSNRVGIFGGIIAIDENGVVQLGAGAASSGLSPLLVTGFPTSSAGLNPGEVFVDPGAGNALKVL